VAAARKRKPCYPAATGSARNPLPPPQQEQPPKWRALPPGCQAGAAGALVPAPRFGTVKERGASDPQFGQGCGSE